VISIVFMRGDFSLSSVYIEDCSSSWKAGIAKPSMNFT
jgi:hypothetical protein